MAKKKRGRRGNGEGSIYRRADGRWVGQYTVETPHGGSKRKTVYGKTRAEVAAKLQEAMARRESEVAEAERKELERRQKTVSAHVEEYLVHIQATSCGRDRCSS